MGRKLQISMVGVVIAAIVGALLMYWWDTTYKDEIAEGVSIGSVEVGGLNAEGAASQVRTNLINPLNKSVTVHFGDQRFRLQPDQLDLRADVEGMVDEALAASREGNIFSRTIRRIGGGEVDRQIEPTIAYSHEAVSAFIDGIASKLNRDALDATVEPTPTSIEPVASQTGIEVDQDALRRDVERALQDPADRNVEAEVDKIKPEVTTDQLAHEYPSYVVVDRSAFTLELYTNLKLAKTYTVAIGALGYDTPTGLYHIQNKQVDPVWNVPDSAWAGDLAGTSVPPGPENPLKARWMGIYDGAGIHGTDDIGSLGSAASHGCVRMGVADVIDLYDRVDIGTPIYIS